MVLWERALGAIGGDNRSAQRLGQPDNLLGPAQHLHFFANHYGGPLGFKQQLQGMFHHIWITLGHIWDSRAQNLNVSPLRQQVCGNLQLYRARTPGLEALEGLHQMVWNGLHLVDHGVPVGDRLKHFQLVFSLVGG